MVINPLQNREIDFTENLKCCSLDDTIMARKREIPTFVDYVITNGIRIIDICSLQLPWEPHRLTRLLQLTGRW